MSKKRIFRFFVFSVLVLSLSLAGFAKKEANESAWTEKPLTIDGQNTDWQDIQPLQKEKLNIDYAFKNDGSNLYVLFTFNEQSHKVLSTLSSSGITLWLNSDGKAKKKYGIKFLRRVITAEHYIALLERRYGPMPEDKKNEFKKKKAYTIYQNGVVNKGADRVIPIKVASNQAPAFKVTGTKEALIYEFRIPLQNEEGKIVGIGAAPGQEIAVGFEWGGMTREYKEMMTKSGPHNPRESKSGVSTEIPGSQEASEIGAGTGTGGSTRTQFARSRTPKKYSFFVPIKLAEKK